MTLMVESVLRRWHGILSPPQVPQPFHEARLEEEVAELEEAKTALEKLSETSDVFFAISRARYQGFHIRSLPDLTLRHAPVYLYMLGKYTSRWGLYRVAAGLCGVANPKSVCEVTNPTKDAKLDRIAEVYDIDPVVFRRVVRRLRWVWPLLP